jgi:hypothetical protein
MKGKGTNFLVIDSDESNEAAIKKALRDRLTRDGVFNPSLLYRGSCANNIGEILQRDKETKLYRIKGFKTWLPAPEVEWFFGDAYALVNSNIGPQNSLFYAIMSQKPLFSVFKKNYFEKVNDEFALIDPKKTFDAFVCTYILKFKTEEKRV